MGNVLSLPLNVISNMNVSNFAKYISIQNVKILLGGCLTCEEIEGGYSQEMMGLVIRSKNPQITSKIVPA